MSQYPASGSRIEVEASEWLVAMNDPAVSLEQRGRFAAWLRANPEHARVYRAQKAAWSAIGNMCHLLEDDNRVTPSQSHTRYFAMAAALVAVLLGAAFFAQHLQSFGARSQYETATGQVRDLKLEDGTVVTLGASSQIRVAFGKTDRRVVLLRGQAFFEVTHDPTRPFYVTAGNTLVRVVGTQFDVNYRQQAVRVAVVEGRVEVSASGPDVVLTAGESAIAAPTGQIATSSALNTSDLSAWRHGRLVYVDARLRDVIADINRYYDGEIEVTDPALGNMQLTAAFRADQIDRVLDVLENALPVRAVRMDGHIVILESSPGH
ncbi:MAG: FecR family protein [Proteobacteria bacterium]|nr:FecR family protein [Pseudomonadota bacterium]